MHYYDDNRDEGKGYAYTIPYSCPSSYTHRIHVHLPSVLPSPRGGLPPLGPTTPPQWIDAHQQRHREGPCTHSTSHRQTRLDSPPPPHIHTSYSTGGYRSYRRWVSRSSRRWGTGPAEGHWWRGSSHSRKMENMKIVKIAYH